MPQRFIKDPSSTLDYQIDWTQWLAGVSPVDTISVSAWEAEPGITIDSVGNTSAKSVVWVSGGTAGREYELTNQITTAGGRIVERSIYISVVDR